jgi:hypothetical protein
VVFATFWVVVERNCRAPLPPAIQWDHLSLLPLVSCIFVWYVIVRDSSLWYISGISFCNVWVSRLLRIHSSFRSC